MHDLRKPFRVEKMSKRIFNFTPDSVLSFITAIRQQSDVVTDTPAHAGRPDIGFTFSSALTGKIVFSP